MIKTILLADDSITMQKVIRLTFASGGYEITTADNGDEAIRKAEETRPHLVLVDAALPGRNGYEVCEAIKTNPLLKNTPVIILAGTFNPLDEGLAKKVGADDSIVKPFESKVLIEKVEALFRIYPPAERTEEPGQPAAAKGRDLSGWAEDDIIRAPEPAETGTMERGREGLAGEAALPEIERSTAEFGDLVPEPEVKAPEEEKAGHEPEAGAVPTMETPHGESEGEDGFDIEGFEINPFKSGPLRDENQPGGEESDVLGGQWSIDEDDVIGFEDINAEEEIRSAEAGTGEEQQEEAREEEAQAPEERPGEREEVPTLSGPEESEEETVPTLTEPGEEEVPTLGGTLGGPPKTTEETAAEETAAEEAAAEETKEEAQAPEEPAAAAPQESETAAEGPSGEEAAEGLEPEERAPEEPPSEEAAPEEECAAQGPEESGAAEAAEPAAEETPAEPAVQEAAETCSPEPSEPAPEESPAAGEEPASGADEAGTPGEETGSPAEEGAEEPLEETGEASASEPQAAEAPSEDAIREMIRKATVDVIEEVVRDTVPELLRKAMEEELDRIKEAIRKA